jgi:hypothetical protein
VERLHFFFETHWDHEPDLRKLLEINKTVFRFMESLDLQDWTRIGAMNRWDEVGRVTPCAPFFAP